MTDAQRISGGRRSAVTDYPAYQTRVDDITQGWLSINFDGDDKVA